MLYPVERLCGAWLAAMLVPAITVAVLAHNEERRIAACLESLPRGRGDVAIHVLVNGSSDRTAEIANGFLGVIVHDWREGGKARSWNRFVLDTLAAFSPVHVFVDGDAVVAPGSIDALAAALAGPRVNAAAALPLNGRRAAGYRAEMRRKRGLFGDLYAMKGAFLARMKAAAIRLPDDLIGDDGLIAALAKTDLGDESHWDDMRIALAELAGFYLEPVSLARPRSLALQYRRMINYSVRHYQNRLISEIMRGPGPAALPERLATLYPAKLAALKPRPKNWWFDRLALQRMSRAV